MTRASEYEAMSAVGRRIDDALADLTAEWAALTSSIRPREGVLHTDDILDLLLDMLRRPGKLIRPRMSYWGWVAGEGDPASYDDVVTVGAALELLHTFGLVQDDVMDASDERRGRPAVHRLAEGRHIDHHGHGDAARFGENVAILAGDLAHAEADHLAGGLPTAVRQVWRRMSIELMIGQGRDLVGAANGRRDLAHARAVARAKSGAYTVWRPLQLGAVAAGAGEATLVRLERYGQAVGEAFALRDDLLGAFGDPALTGKPVGDDLVAGKPTVLLALAVDRVSPAGRDLLRRTGDPGFTTDDVARLQHELITAGVVDEVEAMIAQAVADAEAALDADEIAPGARTGLAGLARSLAWRDR